MHSALAYRLGLRPFPNTAISITQLDGSTLSDGRQMITLTIGELTHRVPIHIHPNAPCNLLIGRNTGYLFNLEISFRLNQVFQSRSNLSPLSLMGTSSVSSNVSRNISSNVLSNTLPSTSSKTLQNILSNISSNVSSNISSNPQQNISSNVSSNISSNPKQNISSNVSSNPQQNILSSVSSNVSSNPQLNISSNVSSNSIPYTSSNVSHNISSSSKVISLDALLAHFKSVFASSSTDIGRIHGVHHHIRLDENTRPIAQTLSSLRARFG